MGLGSVLRFFLPHDDKFLPYFEQSADNLKEAVELYASLAQATNREAFATIREQIKKHEHIGDKLTHNIFEELNISFITPFDREDIYTLTKSLDDVLDLMDHVSDIFVLYRIEKLEDGIREEPCSEELAEDLICQTIVAPEKLALPADYPGELSPSPLFSAGNEPPRAPQAGQVAPLRMVQVRAYY